MPKPLRQEQHQPDGFITPESDSNKTYAESFKKVYPNVQAENPRLDSNKTYAESFKKVYPNVQAENPRLGFCFKVNSFSKKTCVPTDDPHCTDGWREMKECCHKNFEKGCDLMVEQRQETDFDVLVIVRYSCVQKSYLPTLISTLITATRDNMQLAIVLVETDSTAEDIQCGHQFAKDYIKLFKGLNDNVNLILSPRTNLQKETAYYIKKTKIVEQDFGYVLTDLVLNEYLEKHDVGYFMFTNGDNIYGARIFEATELYRRQSFDLIGVFFSSHYKYDETMDNGLNERLGQDILFRSRFQIANIDLGAILFSSEVFKKSHNLRFVSNALERKTKIEWADGLIVDTLIKTGKISNVIVPRILMLHQ